MPPINYQINDNKYCVPAALSAITGRPICECIDLIKKELGDTTITGVFYPIILKILSENGYSFKRTYDGEYVDSGNTVLVCFKGHVGVLDFGTYYDNQWPSGLIIPKNIQEVGYGKVESMWEITKL